MDPNRITTGEWLTTWMDGRALDGDIGPRTIANYRSILNNHLVPRIGHVLLQELRPNHVQALKDELLQSRKTATVRKILVMLRQALDAAVNQELLQRNPASAVRNPAARSQGSERRALDGDEIAKLSRVATGTALEVPIRFALVTGVRQSELLGAEWDAVNLERRTFRVVQGLHYVDGEFRLLPPKTQGSRRTIQLSAKTVGWLLDHRNDQQRRRDRLGTTWEDRNLVFPNASGGYWHRQALSGLFRKLLNQSGIEDPASVSFHSLRHTAASQWIMAGIDPKTVAERLGHSRAAFTLDVYAHMLPGQQDAAAEALDDLLD